MRRAAETFRCLRAHPTQRKSESEFANLKDGGVHLTEPIGRFASVVAGVVLALATLGVATAQVVDSPVSINIVDTPRAQARWGYAPRTGTIAAGTWVTWSNAGQDAH